MFDPPGSAAPPASCQRGPGGCACPSCGCSSTRGPPPAVSMYGGIERVGEWIGLRCAHTTHTRRDRPRRIYLVVEARAVREGAAAGHGGRGGSSGVLGEDAAVRGTEGEAERHALWRLMKEAGCYKSDWGGMVLCFCFGGTECQSVNICRRIVWLRGKTKQQEARQIFSMMLKLNARLLRGCLRCQGTNNTHVWEALGSI